MRCDENAEHYVQAYDGTNPAPLRVDPTTGRLLIAIYVVSDSTSILNSSKIDVNNENVALAVDDNGDIRPFQVDSRNNYLYCDIVEE